MQDMLRACDKAQQGSEWHKQGRERDRGRDEQKERQTRAGKREK